MKIGIIISNNLCLSQFDGVKIQAETWCRGLSEQGHEIVKIVPWNSYIWEDFDFIHVIGSFWDVEVLITGLADRYHKKIAFSPIIDTNSPIWIYKILSFWGFRRLKLESITYKIRKMAPRISFWCARSRYEAKYIHYCYSIPWDQIEIVPLAYRTPEGHISQKRENFCLHVSHMSDVKNVKRLIQAAIKFKFNLVLAGRISKEDRLNYIKEVSRTNSNIKYLGAVNDSELLDLYSKAKVFALPSLYEGVGMVALEAAANGCEIVVTKLGGPKEYYSSYAHICDPQNVDDIGEKILDAMNNSNQPLLQKHIIENYNLQCCMNQLINAYKRRL